MGAPPSPTAKAAGAVFLLYKFLTYDRFNGQRIVIAKLDHERVLKMGSNK